MDSISARSRESDILYFIIGLVVYIHVTTTTTTNTNTTAVYQHQHPILLYLQEYQNISQTLLMMLPVLCSDKILIITALSDLLTVTPDAGIIL